MAACFVSYGGLILFFRFTDGLTDSQYNIMELFYELRPRSTALKITPLSKEPALITRYFATSRPNYHVDDGKLLLFVSLARQGGDSKAGTAARQGKEGKAITQARKQGKQRKQASYLSKHAGPARKQAHEHTQVA